MREVRIHDTLSGELKRLEPREPPRVGIYACGPTVYSRIHVGNARPYVIFMLLRRFLAHAGYEPRLVINLTDVNDKIYDAARAAGLPSAEHAEEMIRAYVRDTDALGLGRPDAEPRATETMAAIIELIGRLIERGHAYESGGDVYFRVRSFPEYGKLSNRDPAEMDQGEEAGAASLKEDPLDFALWKARKEGEDTWWDSPWGPGRPGWHIECSAMAEQLLGLDFEIHGGGSDLVFPHHENEVAQSEAAHGVPLARIWMHNGMIRTAEEKMSKSVGNIFQLSEAIERYGAQAVVAYLISGHYRQPLEFSERALEEAQARVERIRNFLQEGGAAAETGPATEGVPAVEGGGEGEAATGDGGAGPQTDRQPPREDPFAAQQREAVLAALADDFNTPRALAALFELIAEANRRPVPGARATVARLLPLFGLEALLEEAEAGPDPEAERLLREREQARAERDFERADRLRDELAALGWEVRDSKQGPRLVRRGA